MPAFLRTPPSSFSLRCESNSATSPRARFFSCSEMPGLASAARPLASAAVVSDATTGGERAFGTKQRRGVAPAPRRVMGRQSSSARYAGSGASSVPRSTHVDAMERASRIARRAASPVAPGECTSRKRQLVDPLEMARDSPTRRPGVHFLDQKKRAKVAYGTANVEVVVCAAAAVKMPVSAGPERLKKRLAVELDTLREFVKKAKLLYHGNSGRFLPDEPRPEVPVVAGYDKAPSAKRVNTSPIVEHIDARQMSPEEGEIIVVPDPEGDQDCIDICGGVSPVAIRDASPLVPLDKADQSKINIVPEAEQDEYVDICGGATPLAPLAVASEACSPISSGSDSESSSSSGSDSGSDFDDSSSDSDSDSDESVDSPAPAAIPLKQNNSPAPAAIPLKQNNSPAPAAIRLKQNNSPAQPAEDVISVPPPPPPKPASETEKSIDPHENVRTPAPPPLLANKIIDTPAQPPAPALVMVQSTKPEKKLPMSVLLARAKEAREIREQKGNGWEREKTRRAVREMEKAVQPDQSIHPRDLAKAGIAEFEYVLGKLGLSLRPDV